MPVSLRVRYVLYPTLKTTLGDSLLRRPESDLSIVANQDPWSLVDVWTCYAVDIGLCIRNFVGLVIGFHAFDNAGQTETMANTDK